jgi:hypothetical protein
MHKLMMLLFVSLLLAACTTPGAAPAGAPSTPAGVTEEMTTTPEALIEEATEEMTGTPESLIEEATEEMTGTPEMEATVEMTGTPEIEATGTVTGA